MIVLLQLWLHPTLLMAAIYYYYYYYKSKDYTDASQKVAGALYT